ncbi:MAG TPA: SPOR domain-containing protein [bacterium]|nr:SPOR domain-containing protein [bacterium]
MAKPPNSPPKLAPKVPMRQVPAKRSRWMLLSAAIAVVLLVLIGAGLALFRSGKLPWQNKLTVSKQFAPPPPAPAAPPPAAPAAPAPPPEKSYTIKPGENLWTVAKQGTLVSNPWEWRTIAVQNKDKIDYAFISDEDSSWKVMLDAGKELKIHPDGGPGGPAQSGTEEAKYAVQLTTVPDKRLGKATEIVQLLLREGNYAYLYRKELKGKYFYRIRSGFFTSKEQAQQAGEAIVAQFGNNWLFKDFWVVMPSPEERQGQHLDFGAQQTHPWVVELPERERQGQALNDLRKVAPVSSFAYISQKQDSAGPPPHFIYRTRLGFFGSEEAAEKFITDNKQKAPLLAKAQAVRVGNFQEAMPGQTMKLDLASSGAGQSLSPDKTKP